MSLFPLFMVVGVLVLGWFTPWIVPAFVYLVPPLAYRVHAYVFPMREGLSRLSDKGYAPWWGAHQIQLIFIGFPALEAVLRLCGLYSAWLRLWGATIGKNVYWTPLVEVTDRALLSLGDNVVVGHRCGFYGHAIKPTARGLILYVRPIRIGDGAFLSGGCGFGPGAEVAAGAYLPLRTEVYPNRRFVG